MGFVYEPCLTFKEQFDSILGFFFIQVSTPFTSPVNTDIVYPLKLRFGLTIVCRVINSQILLSSKKSDLVSNFVADFKPTELLLSQ
jgi:hypothetical protein